jgi:[ribosomal protein S5]-alanine N-acetyltransferase
MINLKTNRLILRNFHPEDWQDLQELAIHYQASEWAKYEDPWPTATEEVKGIAQFFASGDDYLAVTLQDTGKLIGLIAIERRKEQEGRVHNLGYVFHPEFYGHGYATEGCRSVMAFLFDQQGIDSILTGTWLENTPSVRLLERLGFHSIGNGEFRISKEEWLA